MSIGINGVNIVQNGRYGVNHMTEKRFYYAHGIIFDAHKDNHINKIGTIKDLDIGLRIVNWLNELNDKNQRLSKDKQLAETEVMRIRQSLNEAIETERTQIGRNVLKQFKESLQ